MKKTLSKVAVAVSLLALPAIALAQGNSGDAFSTLSNIAGQLGTIIKALIPVAFGLAILGFFWGIAKYVFSGGNEEAKDQGKKVMLYGLIAIFIMASLFGIINLAQKTTGTTDQGVPVPNIRLPSANYN